MHEVMDLLANQLMNYCRSMCIWEDKCVKIWFSEAWILKMISLRIPAGPCKSILLTSRISFRGFLGLHNGGRTACVRVSSTSSKIGCHSSLNYQSKPFFAPRTPLPTAPPPQFLNFLCLGHRGTNRFCQQDRCSKPTLFPDWPPFGFRALGLLQL